jgi:hypothetical protein
LVAASLCLGCLDRPLFEPDGFHFELLRGWDDDTGGLRRRLPSEWVCLVPSQPLCYCDPRDRERLLGGLAEEERLELNLASRSDLESLPGIGPALAERILEHRSRRPFTRVEELMDVPGIGSGRFRRLQPLVRVDGSSR